MMRKAAPSAYPNDIISTGRALLGAMVVLVASSAPLAAQRVAAPGDRIRLDAPRWYPGYVGEFLGVDNDSLRMQGRRLVLSVPLNAVDGIEISTSTKTRVPEFMFLGTGVGLASGFLLGTVGCFFFEKEGASDCRKELTLVAGTAGSIMGLFLGTQRPLDTWVDAVLAGQVAGLGMVDTWAGLLVVPTPLAAPFSITF